MPQIELKKKTSVISKVPFDVKTDADEDIIEKTVNMIMQSFEIMITNLEIIDIPRRNAPRSTSVDSI